MTRYQNTQQNIEKNHFFRQIYKENSKKGLLSSSMCDIVKSLKGLSYLQRKRKRTQAAWHQ
jgi:hypothetical protein